MNTFLLGFVVSFIFCIVKFIEMRYIARDSYPLKVLCNESLFVFFSVIVGDFVNEQVNPNMIIEDKPLVPEVFTTNPEF